MIRCRKFWMALNAQTLMNPAQVVQAILRHVNFDVAKAVLIASPGFVRQQFFDYMYQQVCSVDYSTRFKCADFRL